ncbi:LysR family transcriptional regulator [Halioxenophilus aromaticivorans]|uniref:LysR family transcriptional regulator n=1 Tax=Halioxenophilus aromaticivorans TaxID=1306992 RepID=A0AAV3U9Q8_9ALTE
MRDWENLRFFLAVARSGTVLAAAKELRVSHSTVLRRIDQFETSLDSKLFRKLQRGYELTQAGETLYAQAQDVAADIDRVLADAEGKDDATGGVLRISQPEIGILNMYPLYAGFRRLHPDITLQIHSTMQPSNVNQQEVDIVFRISESPPDLLVGRCLGQVKAKAYAHQQYLAGLGSQHNSGDYQWILWQPTAEANLALLARENIIDPNVVMYGASMPDVVSAIHHQMGAGFLSTQQAKLHRNLVPLFDGRVFAHYSVWMLTHRDLRNSTRVKTFMRFMADNLNLD